MSAHHQQSYFETVLSDVQPAEAQTHHHPTLKDHQHEQSGQFSPTSPPLLNPGSTRSFGNLPFSSAVTANHFPTTEQDLQLRNWRHPVWKVLPQWEADDSPLGLAYTDFHRLASQLPETKDNQQSHIETSLLFRERKTTDVYNADN